MNWITIAFNVGLIVLVFITISSLLWGWPLRGSIGFAGGRSR